MGLGKTIQTIAYINACREITSALFITPKSLTINWVREWERWSITARPARRVGERGWETADVLVASYEQVKKHRELLEPRSWGVVVVDEAHRIKNQTKRLTPEQAEAELQRLRATGSKRKTAPKRGVVLRTDAVNACLARTRRRLFLTGTPWENRVKELWPLLRMACPEVWDPPGKGGFMDFARRYCDAKRVPIYVRGGGGEKKMVWKFDGASRMPEFQERIRATCVLRRLKTDVLKELPPKIRQLIELDPGRGVEKLLQLELGLTGPRMNAGGGTWGSDEEYAEKLAEMAVDAERPGFAELSRVRAELALLKAPLVAEHVDGLLDGGARKVLVGAWHHSMMDALEKLLAKRGVVRITGRDNTDERQANVDRFQEDGAVRVALGQIDACGVGYNMTAGDHVVLAELPWKPSQCTQFEDRCHRMLQTLPVVVHHLVYRGSVDARMAGVLIGKQRVMEAGLDAR
jgi:SWI/SNF-related matrix-associated actin-dependent regulator 1 of chromatin subfamily A